MVIYQPEDKTNVRLIRATLNKWAERVKTRIAQRTSHGYTFDSLRAQDRQTTTRKAA